MIITVKYKDSSSKARTGITEETLHSNRVTFPPELPYMVVGAWPKVEGKSRTFFLPDIFQLEITS